MTQELIRCQCGEPFATVCKSLSGWWVRCDECKAKTEKSASESEAIAAWNRRRASPSPASDAELPTFDAVWDAIDWDKWRSEPIRELVRHIHTLTAPDARAASTRTASDTRTAAGEAECDAALRPAPDGQHGADEAARAWMVAHGYGNQSFGYALADLQSRLDAARPASASEHIFTAMARTASEIKSSERSIDRTRAIADEALTIIDTKLAAATRTAGVDEGELRKLALAATPGPWVADNPWNSDDGPAIYDAKGDRVADDGSAWGEYEQKLKANDADYIAAANPAVILALLDELAAARTQADAGKERELYKELLFAVARKFPGESRHETALRYIRAAEAPSASPAQATNQENT